MTCHNWCDRVLAAELWKRKATLYTNSGLIQQSSFTTGVCDPPGNQVWALSQRNAVLPIISKTEIGANLHTHAQLYLWCMVWFLRTQDLKILRSGTSCQLDSKISKLYLTQHGNLVAEIYETHCNSFSLCAPPIL